MRWRRRHAVRSAAAHLNGPEIHGFLDDIGVVRDAELYIIHRLRERPTVFVVDEVFGDTQAGLARFLEDVHLTAPQQCLQKNSEGSDGVASCSGAVGERERRTRDG